MRDEFLILGGSSGTGAMDLDLDSLNEIRDPHCSGVGA